MKYTLLLLLSLIFTTLNAQDAKDYFPQTSGAAWQYRVDVTLNDSTTTSFTRNDVLTAVSDTADVRYITMTSIPAGVQTLKLRGDSVRASLNLALPLAGVLELDSLTANLLGGNTPETTLFTTNAPIGQLNEQNTLRQRIETPRQLRDAIETDGVFAFTLSDSLDVVVTQSFRREANELLILPAGEYETIHIQTILALSAEIEGQTAFGTLRLTLPLLEDYILSSWYSAGTGLVRQKADPRVISVADSLLQTDSPLDSIAIPGFDMQLTEFSPTAETSTASSTPLANQVRLHANYPNPFNPTTTIPFELDQTARVSLSIWDVRGARVVVLLDQTLGPGMHQVQFQNARNLSSGVYFVRLEAQTASGVIRQVQPITLVK